MDRAAARRLQTDPTLFADDFEETPWWWEAAPRPDEAPASLPERVDVVVVGSGFTGCSAALALARGGRDVLVLEADRPGFGASSRNAGFVGRTLKHSLGQLVRTLGEARAVSVYRELADAFEFVATLVEREQIACHFTRCGRYIATFDPRQYEQLARELELKSHLLGDGFEMVPAGDDRRELGSTHYAGGAIVEGLGSIHPGLYHLGLLDRARSAGALVVGGTPVTGLEGSAPAIRVRTDRGTVVAREVVVATNGYTGAATPWHRRRVVPFDGYMIATERLDEATIEKLLPRGRTYHDFNNNIDFFRRAPDEPRILFGGRTGMVTDDLGSVAALLHRRLTAVLPDLHAVRLSRVWTGQCAGTFDLWPHTGERDGVHYAMGYCYAGLPMGTWLGHKVARRILGAADAATEFERRGFPTIPLYRGGRWPARLAIGWYDLQDWRSTRRR